ncbi:MAG: hypothetical protein B0W54_19885 [Cellvibrio sp. 79]|nr:MAG: hypothetical protein B0W54_19885 [Cellvibrio sp. 79]
MDKFPETLTLAAATADDIDELPGWVLDELDINTDDDEIDDWLDEIVELDREDETVLLEEELKLDSCFPLPEPPPQAPRDKSENNNAGFIICLINMMQLLVELLIDIQRSLGLTS